MTALVAVLLSLLPTFVKNGRAYMYVEVAGNQSILS